ncbi:MAG: preprotein translocase subunit SecE [Sedimenticola sp.]|jgi:preprotein translocase subunit SecE|nr:MAG: preprotein translocase subunit SecE [Sedimenticola sp.]
MNAKTEVESSTMDTVKLLLSVLMLTGGIAVFYYLEGQPLWVRILGLLAIVGAAAFVALQSVPGRNVWDFAVASRAEVRKVVWPSRQETIQTTLIVFVMVLIMGIVLWLFDMLLMAIVRGVTG